MRRLAGSNEERSVGELIHLAPIRSQNEQVGFLLSHFVRLALHTWHALLARRLGYAAVPLGAGREPSAVASESSVGSLVDNKESTFLFIVRSHLPTVSRAVGVVCAGNRGDEPQRLGTKCMSRDQAPIQDATKCVHLKIAERVSEREISSRNCYSESKKEI